MTAGIGSRPAPDAQCDPLGHRADVMLTRVLRRDRLVVSGALAAAILACWAYLLAGAGMDMSALDMTRTSQQALFGELPAATMMQPASWTPGHALTMFFMWWVMMSAMMLPSAAPMILFFAAVSRRQGQRGHAYVPASLFAGTYLVTWAGFSAAAVALQWGLQHLGWLSPVLVSRSAALAGALLILGGIYQLTPVKQACLRHCRSPLHFVSTQWRQGHMGAVRMGMIHGAYCVGCCWFLMGLLFVGGVMNLWWVAGLALFVLVEKTVPAGRGMGIAAGIVLLGAGTVVLATSLPAP